MGKASLVDDGLQIFSHAGGVGASHDEVKVGMGWGHDGEGLQQQVAAFFRMDTREEEQVAAAFVRNVELRATLIECRNQRVDVRKLRIGAIGDDHGIPMPEPEGFGGEIAFKLGGKHDARSSAEHPILREQPVDPLLHMLEWIAALEVGVEHAVGEDKEGLVSGDGDERGKARELPKSVDDDAVEAVAILDEPGN
jgi:hypothetical protein